MGSPEILVDGERERDRLAFGWLKSCGPAALVISVSLLLAARLFRLTSQYAVNLFFWDEWDLKEAPLFERYSAWQMFVSQHWWHRLGLGPWFEAIFEPPFHWNSRVEAFAQDVILVTVVICALWLSKRLKGSISVFDVLIPAIFFTPAQWEILFGTPIFSQGPLPTLLIMLYCLAWMCENRLLRYPLVLLINFVTIYTGFGLFLGVLTPVLLILDRYSRDPSSRLPGIHFAAVLVVSLGSFASFFIGYVPAMGIPCKEHSPHFYIVFMALIWAHFLALDWTGFLPRIVGKGFLIVLVVSLVASVWFLLRRQADGFRQKMGMIASLLMALSLLTCLIIAYSRLCGGIASALAPRYAVYVQLGVLGLYFHFASMRSIWGRKYLVAGLVIVTLLASLHVDHPGMAYFRDLKQRWKACYLQSEDVARCDQFAGFPMHPRRAETHLDQKLQFLKERHLNLYSDSK